MCCPGDRGFSPAGGCTVRRWAAQAPGRGRQRSFAEFKGRDRPKAALAVPRGPVDPSMAGPSLYSRMSEVIRAPNCRRWVPLGSASRLLLAGLLGVLSQMGGAYYNRLVDSVGDGHVRALTRHRSSPMCMGGETDPRGVGGPHPLMPPFTPDSDTRPSDAGERHRVFYWSRCRRKRRDWRAAPVCCGLIPSGQARLHKLSPGPPCLRFGTTRWAPNGL